MPGWTSSGLIMPPEVESSQRQMMTTTTVGTIQVRMIQVRASFTPGNFWLRISAAPSAASVCTTALPATQTRLRRSARQKRPSPSTAA